MLTRTRASARLRIIHRPLIRFKRIPVTRHLIHHVLQKLQRRVHILMPVKRYKTPRKQFRHRLHWRKPRQYVPPPKIAV